MGSCMSTHSAGAATAPGSRSGKRWKRSRREESGEKSRRGSRLFAWSADPAKAAVCDGPSEEELLRVPGRMSLNGSSDGACLYTQQGRKGTNQDAMVVWENFASTENTVFCGVFDGHGPYGHMVAKKVRDSLPVKVCDQWKTVSSEHTNRNDCVGGSTNSEETASVHIEDEWTETVSSEGLPDLFFTLRQALLKAFKLMDKELKLHPTIDCFCSGSTAVTIIKQGQDLIIGNIGDSRAVLCTRDKDDALTAVQLTVDLKPNLPREAARIQKFKGRVFALQDEPEVARVWLPNSDSPGLAMARAFGDFCLKDYGLISVPDVSYRRLTERDEFIVLATDGVWDVLSNKEVVDIVASAPTRATAARAVIESAVRAWRLKYPTSKSDDCAVVCLFLNPLPSDQTGEALSPNIPKEQTEPSAVGVPNGETIEKLEFHAVTEGCEQVDTTTQQTSSDAVSEIIPVDGARDDRLHERCHSTRSIAECISTTEEQEWSALEGVTRVNSLVNLPRFLASDKKSGSRRKWF